jgi:lactoylglutathione lyase
MASNSAYRWRMLCGHATLPSLDRRTGGSDVRPLWAERGVASGRAAHLAFQVELADLHAAPSSLRNGGINPLDFAGALTEEPVVLAWMPAASVYFHDADNNLLEFITMLPGPARPEFEVLL